MRSHGRTAYLGLAAALLLGGCAGYHGTARVPTIDGLRVAREPGVPNRIAVTAVGTVPNDGWSKIRLRPLHAPTHPPGVVAFELVGTSPRWRTAVTPGERRYSATALAEVPPGTQLIYVLAGVNDDAKAMPGTAIKRHWRRARWRKRMRRTPTKK
jgi:hypothetical protein